MINEMLMTLNAFGIPTQLIVCIVCVVLTTEYLKKGSQTLEDWLETKLKHEVMIFDHCKIILLIMASIVGSCVLYQIDVINLKAIPLYTLCIIGASSSCYELILKKIKRLMDE